MPSLSTGRRINGKVYAYDSITININGIPYEGVTEISYSDTCEPGILRGTSPFMRGRTRGMYEAESSVTMDKESFEIMKAALVAMGLGGFMEAEFLINVVYREDVRLITDTVEGCRIKHVENSHSAGNADGLVTKFDLSVYRIGWNGHYGIAPAVGGNIGGLISP